VPCSASRVVPAAHRVVGPVTHRGSGPREVHTTGSTHHLPPPTTGPDSSLTRPRHPAPAPLLVLARTPRLPPSPFIRCHRLRLWPFPPKTQAPSPAPPPQTLELDRCRRSLRLPLFRCQGATSELRHKVRNPSVSHVGVLMCCTAWTRSRECAIVPFRPSEPRFVVTALEPIPVPWLSSSRPPFCFGAS
jgi:hypothetical protein